MDDMCLYDKTIEENFWATVKYIKVCSKSGIVFNPEKFVFGREELDFVGFTVSTPH